MRVCFKLLFLIISLVLVLCACTSENSGGTSSGEDSVDIPSSFAPLSVDSSEEGSTHPLVAEAERLLALDGQVIDIFANLSLAPHALGLEKAEYGYKLSDKYYPLEGCVYEDYSRLVALLESVYGKDSAAAERYLTKWPPCGNSVFRADYLGKTQMCCTYNAGFDTAFGTGYVSYLGKDGEMEAFQYSNGGRIFVFNLKPAEGGYVLENSCLFAEEDREGPKDDYLTEDAGSASDLAGRCLWLNIFAEDTKSVWTEEDKAAVQTMVEEATGRLGSLADDYGVSLKTELAWTDLALTERAVVEDANPNWTVSAFEPYGGLAEYVKGLLGDKEWDSVYINFHFNYYGRSFCVPCSDADSDPSQDNYYETAVSFFGQAEEGDYYACPAVYMHELLHAFGAKDLYEGTLTARGNDTALMLFPKDIMRYEPADIEKCTVGALTAKLIGWSDRLPLQLKDLLKECR